MKDMNRRWLRGALIVVMGCFAGLAVSAIPEWQGWTWRRPVSVPVSAAEFGQLVLPPEVIDASAAHLADLRLIDAHHQPVPFLLAESHTENPPPADWMPVQILNRVIGSDESRMVTLEFGQAMPRNELRVQLSDRDYYREVQLEGSHDLLRWFSFAEAMVLADVHADDSFRLDTLRFSDNNYRYLRMTVRQTPGKVRPFTIEEVTYRNFVENVVETVSVATGPLSLSTDKNGNTWVELDLGARHLPLNHLSMQVADPWFYRAVAVSGRNTLHEMRSHNTETGAVYEEREAPWTPVTSTVVYRSLSPEGTISAGLTIDLPLQARFRYLRLMIYNQDNPPLQIQQVAVERAVTRLVFPLRPLRPGYLIGGYPQAKAPRYDLEQALPGLAHATAETLTLGELETIANASPQLPWTERHRGLLLGVLLVTALILGFIVLRQLRQTSSGQAS